MLSDTAARLQQLCDDLKYTQAQDWAAAHPGRPVVGYLPAYMPRELVYAAGGLAVGIWGGGIATEIVHGDAYYQSYICRLPRSVIELAMHQAFERFDGLVFPSICDVIRNLSGMWKILFPKQWVKYLDLPQNLSTAIGGSFYKKEMKHLAELILGRQPDAQYEEALRQAIALTNRQLELLWQLKRLRLEKPHLVPIDEYYYLLRAALLLHPEEHMAALAQYLAEVEGRQAKEMDNIRVLLIGAFCEQPPIGLLRTIERAGCYIVEHDLLIGLHWFTRTLDESGDPFDSLVDGYLNRTTMAAFKYQDQELRGEHIVKQVQQARADGVILAAPSFCDPALLERPMLTGALEAAGIPFTTFQYAENTGQYQSIKEQAGTFSDSVRLWV